MKRVSLEEFEKLSKDDQWALIPKDLKRAKSNEIITLDLYIVIHPCHTTKLKMGHRFS
jgi:hypothetical protein